MGTLIRSGVLASLVLALASASVSGAELSIGVPLDRREAPGAPVTLTVLLQAAAAKDAKYLRSSWLDELIINAFDKNGRALPIRVVARRKGPETVVHSEVPGDRMQQDGIGWRAEVDVDGISEGRPTVRVEYQDLKREITLVEPGGKGENRAQSSMRSEPDKKPNTWGEFRAVALKRLEDSPNDWTILWDLAQAAIGAAPQEETEDYLRRAIESQNSFIEGLRSSESKEDRAAVPALEAELRANKAMASAIRSLLPAYYADRERQSLSVDWLGNEAALLDRKTHKVIKSVRFSADGRLLNENKQ